MIKPEKLHKGDRIAIVSLSWGGLGDEGLIHKYHIAKERLEKDFGLEVVAMPHALSGSKFVYEHPELRAKDLMDAFLDPSIKGIFSAIGGDDSVRILPYIDDEIIRNHPKIFMGYSDTTVSHFIMNKAGVNIGHASPIGILPLGIEYEIDLDQKTIRLAESATSGWHGS